MRSFISASSTNSNGPIPCSASWCTSQMHSWVSPLNTIRPLLFPDIIPDHDERIPLFTRASETDPELPYGALLRYTPYPPMVDVSDTISSALDSQDDVVQLKTAQIFAVFLSSEITPIAPNILQPFLSTLSSFLISSLPHKRDLAVQCLEALLPRREVRKAVWAIPQMIQGYEGKPLSYLN